MPSNKTEVGKDAEKQEALHLQRCRTERRGTEYFAKSLKVTEVDWK